MFTHLGIIIQACESDRAKDLPVIGLYLFFCVSAEEPKSWSGGGWKKGREASNFKVRKDQKLQASSAVSELSLTSVARPSRRLKFCAWHFDQQCWRCVCVCGDFTTHLQMICLLLEVITCWTSLTVAVFYLFLLTLRVKTPTEQPGLVCCVFDE